MFIERLLHRVLVVRLGRIEGLQGNDLGYDRILEDPGFIELCDVRLGNPLLLVGATENGGTVLSALVGTLPVQLCGVVSHREKDAKQLAVSDFGRIVRNLDRLRMTGLSVLTSSYCAVLAEPPEYPEVARITPFVCWNTA